ncbi:MAG: FeoA domain-containing protein [Bacteroidota bacterium]
MGKLRSRKAQIEDILKQLYHVGEGGKSAGIIDLSGILNISQKRMFELIGEMVKMDLIQTKNEKIILTQTGQDYALRIIRVHRLWEKYLSEKTGINKLEWHDRAEEKEHQLTHEQAESLYEELGRPRFDPHGDPIPTELGQVVEIKTKPLSGLHKGAVARIKHIEDEPEVIYKQIIAKKLHIGSQVKVMESNDNKIKFYSEGNEYTLPSIVACNISVLELSEEEIFEDSKVRLSSLNEGEKARILGISTECRGAARRRLMDLGFIKGTEIETEYNGPNSNPKAYKLRNTLIALRNDQADLVLIEKEAV